MNCCNLAKEKKSSFWPEELWHRPQEVVCEHSFEYQCFPDRKWIPGEGKSRWIRKSEGIIIVRYYYFLGGLGSVTRRNVLFLDAPVFVPRLIKSYPNVIDDLVKVKCKKYSLLYSPYILKGIILFPLLSKQKLFSKCDDTNFIIFSNPDLCEQLDCYYIDISFTSLSTDVSKRWVTYSCLFWYYYIWKNASHFRQFENYGNWKTKETQLCCKNDQWHSHLIQIWLVIWHLEIINFPIKLRSFYEYNEYFSLHKLFLSN